MALIQHLIQLTYQISTRLLTMASGTSWCWMVYWGSMVPSSLILSNAKSIAGMKWDQSPAPPPWEIINIKDKFWAPPSTGTVSVKVKRNKRSTPLGRRVILFVGRRVYVSSRTPIFGNNHPARVLQLSVVYTEPWPCYNSTITNSSNWLETFEFKGSLNFYFHYSTFYSGHWYIIMCRNSLTDPRYYK